MILTHAWRACQLFLLKHWSFRNGTKLLTPSADATITNALDVVLHTCSSRLSMWGHIVAMIVANPTDFDKLLIISIPSILEW